MMHRAMITTSLFFISTAFRLTQELSIAASTHSLERSLKESFKCPQTTNSANTVLRMTLSSSVARATRVPNRRTVSQCVFNMGSGGGGNLVSRVGDVENTFDSLLRGAGSG